jgi:multidrug efflux pump
VPVRDVAGTLQTLLGGRRVSTFTRNNKLYDVIVRLFPEERATPGDIPTLYVRGRGGELVQLDALATVKEGVGPQRLIHFNRVRSFTLTAGLAPGFTLGEALDSLDALAAEVLPEGATTALAGESRELQESGASLYFAFGLALLVVFMVLASQFESLVHPFTVLLAVPLAVTGALAALYVAGSTINLYSQIGMILLIGLVTKNSILLVEFTNQLRERGMDTVAAVLEAGRVRLRPIVMTSVSTIMGAMPIAFGLGAGSMSRKPLGYAIIGGILFSTVLTLFLVPVAYVLLDRCGSGWRGARRRGRWRPNERRPLLAAGGGGRLPPRGDPGGGARAERPPRSELRRGAGPGADGGVGPAGGAAHLPGARAVGPERLDLGVRPVLQHRDRHARLDVGLGAGRCADRLVHRRPEGVRLSAGGCAA